MKDCNFRYYAADADMLAITIDITADVAAATPLPLMPRAISPPLTPLMIPPQLYAIRFSPQDVITICWLLMPHAFHAIIFATYATPPLFSPLRHMPLLLTLD